MQIKTKSLNASLYLPALAGELQWPYMIAGANCRSTGESASLVEINEFELWIEAILSLVVKKKHFCRFIFFT